MSCDRPDKDEATGSNPVSPTSTKTPSRYRLGVFRVPWGGTALGSLALQLRADGYEQYVGSVATFSVLM
ncbi:hypothetical protein GCM10023336_14370 [Streptomyces similanensis]|uniref:Uncharacterized protein n=1 Tax=Streptomyces similanensis TaxID=1274988 RepID=A0ABP9K2U8_9ACTN